MKSLRHGTPSGTADWVGRQGLSLSEMGRTGLFVSQAGFGGYRIAAGVMAHAHALRRALISGINLIDTSANYGDGASEELVGEVLEDLIQAKDLRREAVVVVSKAGYLQGHNYALSQARRRQGQPFPELVPYAEGLEHCIHPEFLDDQLTRSLARLRLETLDVYLLHNPEYFLSWAFKNGMDPAEAQGEYYRRIENAFRYLWKPKSAEAGSNGMGSAPTRFQSIHPIRSSPASSGYRKSRSRFRRSTTSASSSCP